MNYTLLTKISLLIFSLYFFSCSKEDEEKPNIILIIADDMAWNDCGVYGNKNIRTPNIDFLAKNGLKFNQAFLTISSCSPSRSSIITGKYPHNTDAEQLHWALPESQLTFVELLKNTGYYTASAGKWHLGEAIKNRFDKVIEADVSGFQLPVGSDGEQKAMVAKQQSGCEDWIPTLKNRPSEKPFFMWFAALDPHRDYKENSIDNPHKPEDVLIPPHLPDVPDVRKDLALYYDEITRLDDYVGQVYNELKKQNVIDNTIIIFMSDNGRPFPRDKTTLYDGGIKTPFIVHWPNHITPNSESDELISSVDIAPTLLDITKINIPKIMEGQSFLPLLKNQKTNTRGFIFAEDHWHDFEDLTLAARSKQYKYIQNIYNDLPATPSADAGRSITFKAMINLKEKGELNNAQLNCFKVRPKQELYDVVEDPDELNNLAENTNYKEVLETHKKALEQWKVETNFKIPLNRTPDEFDRETGDPLPPRIRPRPDKKWFVDKYGIE